jgi:hypothetical protein
MFLFFFALERQFQISFFFFFKFRGDQQILLRSFTLVVSIGPPPSSSLLSLRHHTPQIRFLRILRIKSSTLIFFPISSFFLPSDRVWLLLYKQIQLSPKKRNNNPIGEMLSDCVDYKRKKNKT